MRKRVSSLYKNPGPQTGLDPAHVFAILTLYLVILAVWVTVNTISGCEGKGAADKWFEDGKRRAAGGITYVKDRGLCFAIYHRRNNPGAGITRIPCREMEK